jgi:hypothetical protein
MIPKILHFCFGLSPDFGGKPWSLIHHACVLSAVERIRPERAILHCQHEPAGPWWRLTRPFLTVNRIEAPTEVFGRPLMHVAHRADVLRLRALLDQGGIYLDADVFVHRDFDDLLGHSVVMGLEGQAERQEGLCNGVILAEPGAPFLARWFDEYRSFRSKGRDEFWNEHSVKLPLRLMREYPAEITVLPYNAFHWPTSSPEDLRLIYEPGQGVDARGLYANHLWETLAWWSHLRDLTPGRVRATDSQFHLWVREHVKDLPDGYGAPGLVEKVGRKLRHWMKTSAG